MRRPPEEALYRQEIKRVIRDIESRIEKRGFTEKKNFTIFKEQMGKRAVFVGFDNGRLSVTAFISQGKLLNFNLVSDSWVGVHARPSRKMDPLVFLKDALAVL